MRVLMLTQKIDRDDDRLGFMHGWAAALAARVDSLRILALAIGRYDLPANVIVESMGKERGAGRPGLLLSFYRGLLRHIRQVDVILIHMIPRFAILAAPVAALYRKPMTLWYTHRAASPELRLAARLVQKIATAHPTSFPLPSAKVRALGHGIDITAFAPSTHPPEEPPVIVSLARLSPIKRHETLLRAAALLRDQYGDPPARFVIAGGAVSAEDAAYEQMLREEITRLRLGDRAALWGAVPADSVGAVFHDASVAVNLSPPGLFDKAALEAMLCGLPVVVANAAFDDTLGDHAARLRIPDGTDAAALAARLADLLALSPEERRAIGLDLRARAAAAHSLETLMDRLMMVLRK